MQTPKKFLAIHACSQLIAYICHPKVTVEWQQQYCEPLIFRTMPIGKIRCLRIVKRQLHFAQLVSLHGELGF
jgi:hypothetical protein